MADKATPKAMGSLSNREQEIVVAALSKCLKNGDIQVSQMTLPYPPTCRTFFLKFSFTLQFFLPLCIQGSDLLVERLHSGSSTIFALGRFPGGVPP